MRLIVRTLVVLLACAGGISGARAYLGEDPGLNLYRTVDRSSGILEARLMQKYLRGSGAKVNDFIGKACQGEGGELVKCLDGMDFSAEDLARVLDGPEGVGALRARLNPEIRSVSTETLSAMLSTVRNYRDALASDAREERRGMELFGSVGLFADGSIENSGYDLMYDLEQINKVIFKQPPTYEGLTNGNAHDINGILSGFFGNDTEDVADDEGEETEAGTGALLGGEVSGAPRPRTGTGTATGSTVPASLCPPVGGYPSDFLTAGVIALPAIAVAAAGSGASATGVTVGPREPTLSFVGREGDGNIDNLRGSRDSYSCRGDQIFCIEIKFTTYSESFGFGGGLGSRGNSIEDVLDQNLRIFDKYSSSSFAQARMTNNFFELSLKDIDLPSMGHIGTVISKKPPPLLNIGKSGEQTQEDVDKEDEKEFDEIFSRSFSAYGLDYGRQNELSNPCVDYQITLLKNLTTEAVSGKSGKEPAPTPNGNPPPALGGLAGCKPGGSADELYPSVKAEEQKEGYYRGFSKDLNEMGRFVDTLAGNVSDAIGVIKGIHAIPKSK